MIKTPFKQNFHLTEKTQRKKRKVRNFVLVGILLQFFKKS